MKKLLFPNEILFVFQTFQKRLKKARRIVVIGNGGIATELVFVFLDYKYYHLHTILSTQSPSMVNQFDSMSQADFININQNLIF